MCKKPVERSIFEEYTSFGSHMNIRKQAQFCKVHMKRDAEREWEERRYPIIDWQCLDVRIAKYHDTIDEILRRTKFSFYRNVFADSIKDGKSKTLPQSLISGGENEAATHGYYGTRGARVMYGLQGES